MNVKLFSRLSYVRFLRGLDSLQPRERWFLLFGGLFVVGFFVVLLVIEPFLQGRQALVSSLAGKRRDVQQMIVLQREYRELVARRGSITRRIEQRAASFSLFSYLEQQAAAAVIKDRVTSMKPSVTDADGGLRESAVELHLEMITIDQLVGFLSAVESPAQVIIVKRLAIQQSSANPTLLDVVMTIITYEQRLGSDMITTSSHPGALSVPRDRPVLSCVA